MDYTDADCQPFELPYPRRVGDYLVRGYAIRALDGGFWPAYIIDRVAGIQGGPKIAAGLCTIRRYSYSNETQARTRAFSHGQDHVQSRDNLEF